MKHSFDIKMAQIYGLEESILIDNLLFWIAKNKANSKHFYNGKYWTYNSTKAFSELFPYWNEKKISRIIASLVEQNVIEKGCFNQNSYDRTTWFSFTEKWIIDNPDMSDSISQICQMEQTEIGNGNSKNGKSSIRTDSKPNKKQIKETLEIYLEKNKEELAQTFKDYPTAKEHAHKWLKYKFKSDGYKETGWAKIMVKRIKETSLDFIKNKIDETIDNETGNKDYVYQNQIDAFKKITPQLFTPTTQVKKQMTNEERRRA